MQKPTYLPRARDVYKRQAHYYVATAADRIIAPPGARFEVLGLYSEVTFLKDALARVGLTAEVVQISPYKTAYDLSLIHI